MQPTTNMLRLLAADAQRSDDPDLEAPVPAAAASPSPIETAPYMQRGMHCVMGTFADPSPESAFAAALALTSSSWLLCSLGSPITLNPLVSSYGLDYISKLI